MRYGSSSSCRTRSALPVRLSSASKDFDGSTICTISTLSNWCWRIIPRVSRPEAPASLRKHGVWATNFSGSCLASRICPATMLVSETSAVGIRYRSGSFSRPILNRSSSNFGSWPVPCNAGAWTR
ncbi:hypothetical protein D3C76_1260480 [compost metagenome]